MKLKGLIIALLLLAVLSGALYWSNLRQPADSATGAPPSSAVKILALNRDDLTKIEVAQKGGDDVVLSKAASGNWSITAPKMLIADQDQVASLLTAISPVNSDRVIDDKATDLQPYGLAQPLVSVSATGKDGKIHDLLIGDDTPTGGATYAMLQGDPRVFTVTSLTKTSLNKSLNDLRDKHLLPVNYDNLSRVELAGPKLDVTFALNNGQWIVQNPKDVRADTSKVATVIDKLRAAVIDPAASETDLKQSAAAFSSGSAVTTVKITDSSGTDELQVRKNKDAYYAKSSAMDGVYKITGDLGEAIASQNLDDFRERKLLDAAANEPSKVNFEVNGKSYSLSRTGAEWSADGKKMEFATVEAFLNSLRDLAGTKFVTSGFGAPSVTLTVTSDDGKMTDKIAFSKDGDHYVAKRDNDSLLYEVPATTIDNLQKSADAMKPMAATPSK